MSEFVAFETPGGRLVWVKRNAVVVVREALPAEAGPPPSTKITLTSGSPQFVVGSPDAVLLMLEPEEAGV